MNRKEWTQNRADELALGLTNHEFHDLGPHLQLMVYTVAEQDYVDYYSSLIDSTYEHIKYQRLGC